jgi:hypothetical protein
MPYAAAVVAGVRAGVGDRPYAWLQVINPVTLVASRREFGLIDSGCDQCFLDRGLLAGLGLTTHSSTVVVAGGGTVAVDIALNAEIEIEGVVVSGVPLTFGPATVSLIGRDIYLRAFELAFRTNDWLHA